LFKGIRKSRKKQNVIAISNKIWPRYWLKSRER